MTLVAATVKEFDMCCW